MKKRNFLLGVLFLAIPLYHHLLWIYIWNNYDAGGYTQKREHFTDLILFPEAIHQYAAFFFPIIAFIFLGKSMDDLKSTAERVFAGFLMVLAVLCWGLTGWSLMQHLFYGKDSLPRQQVCFIISIYSIVVVRPCLLIFIQPKNQVHLSQFS